MISDAQALANLRARLTQDAFYGLADYGLPLPDRAQLWFGVLDMSTLKLFEQDASIAKLSTSMTPIELENHNYQDVGAVIPNGFYFFHNTPPPGTERILLMYMDIRGGVGRFLTIPRPEGVTDTREVFSPTAIAHLQNRPVLIYNKTENPKPLLGFMSYEPDERDSYRWHFIDLCVNLARNRLLVSRHELHQLLETAQSVVNGNYNEKFDKMVRELRNKAMLYTALEGLRDLLKFIAYIRLLVDVSTGGVTYLARRLNLGQTGEQDFTDFVRDTIPQLEANLIDKGRRLTIDQLISKIDEITMKLRKSAPLLGRLSWAEIALRTDAQLAAEVVSLTNKLMADNQQAERMLDEDIVKIRRLLTVVPPRVMGIQRIVKEVEDQNSEEINGNVHYFFTVLHLKSQAESFPLILGLYSLVFSFFCPPVGVALGFFSSQISNDEALFKRFLSDSDVNVDETIVTQAEAREAEFWAAVDSIFFIVDLNSLVKSIKTAKALKEARKFEEFAQLNAELGQTAERTAEAKRRIAQLGEAVNPESLARAANDLNVEDARRGAQQARAGQIDMNNSPRLENPPDNAQAVIRNADPSVRNSLVGPMPDSSNRAIKDVIDANYVQHFNEATEAVEDARRAGRPLPPGPLKYENFARAQHREILDQIPLKNIATHPRVALYDNLEGTGRGIGNLLENPAALTEAMANRVRSGNIIGLGKFDQTFWNRFSAAVGRGDSSIVLENLVRERFLQPIDALASKAGFTSATRQSREFGLFAAGVENITIWSGDALKSLRGLHGTDGISHNALQTLLNNPNLSPRRTPRFNMEVAVALENIKSVEGVMNRAAATNLSLFESLVDGNRGHGFEAILASRLLDPARREGATLVIGRRWTLNRIAELRNLEGARYTNVLEADILVEFGDGRRVLIDAKFFDGRGLKLSEGLDSQLAKIAQGIEEGLIHNGEYWVSHKFASRANFETFRSYADFYSHGKIHIVANLYDSGAFPQNFFQASRFEQVSRGADSLIIEYSGLKPITMPSVVPEVVAPPANALIPEPVTIADRIPVRTQAEAVRAEAEYIPVGSAAHTESSAGEVSQSRVPIRPLAIHQKIRIVAAPTVSKAETLIDQFLLIKCPPGSYIADQMQGGLRQLTLRGDAFEIFDRDNRFDPNNPDNLSRKNCVLNIAVDAKDLKETPIICSSRDYFLSQEATHFHILALIRMDNTLINIPFQIVLYDQAGRELSVRTGPDSGYFSLLPTATIIPITSRDPNSPFYLPLTSRVVRLGVRALVGGRVVNDRLGFSLRVLAT